MVICSDLNMKDKNGIERNVSRAHCVGLKSDEYNP